MTLMPVQMELSQNHVAPQCSCRELRNVMLALIVFSRPCDANTDAVTSRDSCTNASGIM